MSIERIIIRCDEPMCTANADLTKPGEVDGWLLRMVQAGFANLAFDYCEHHAEAHR